MEFMDSMDRHSSSLEHQSWHVHTRYREADDVTGPPFLRLCLGNRISRSLSGELWVRLESGRIPGRSCDSGLDKEHFCSKSSRPGHA